MRGVHRCLRPEGGRSAEPLPRPMQRIDLLHISLHFSGFLYFALIFFRALRALILRVLRVKNIVFHFLSRVSRAKMCFWSLSW